MRASSGVKAESRSLGKTTPEEAMLAELKAWRALLARDAPGIFRSFLRHVNTKYECEWFHRLIADKCQSLLEGTLGKDRLMVFMPPQHGKALSVDTPTLTANRGWVRHGDLMAGDLVFSPSGEPVRVEAVTGHYTWECRKVAFAQGETITASFNHEWGCYIPDSNHVPVYYPDVETDEVERLRGGGEAYVPASALEKGGVSRHYIKTITPCGTRTVNCIQVEGGYYLCGEQLIPTHNSSLISQYFPAWALGRDPDLRIVGASYSASLSTQFSRHIQRTMESDEYRAVFPGTYANGGRGKAPAKGYVSNIDMFETVGHKGFYKAVGVGGSLTGTPADIAIIDDPVKDREEAYSSIYRERVWNWYNSVLKTRLHNGSKVLFVMTRWHEDDLAGRILRTEGGQWEVVKIPAICEEEGDGDLGSPRHVGDALWESRHSLSALLQAKASSPSVFASLYQQRPVIEGGNIVKREWFRSISQQEFKRRRFRQTVKFYLDTGYSEHDARKDNDPSGIIATCTIGGDLYITHAQRMWKGMPELLRFLPVYVNGHSGGEESVLYVEPKANGISVVQMLQRQPGLNVRRTKAPQDSKETRLHVVTPFIEGGRVYLVEGDWNEDFLAEVCGFPAQPHDEFVDLLSYALDDMRVDHAELSRLSGMSLI